MGMSISSMVVKVLGDVTDFQAKMAVIDKQLAATSAKLATQAQASTSNLSYIATAANKVGSTMQTVGAGLTQYVTLPLALGLAGAAKVAVDFDTAFAGVRKTVSEGRDEITGAVTDYATLKQSIIDTSNELGVSKDAIAEIMQTAGQLGIRGNEALGNFTNTVAKLTITTGESAGSLAMMLGKIVAIAGISVEDNIEKMGAVITALGNNTATTEREILKFTVRAAAAGRIAGMTVEDIMAISAAFEATGTKAERGGTAFTKIMLTMQTEARGVATATSEFGISLDNNNAELVQWQTRLEEAQQALDNLGSSATSEQINYYSAEIATAQENIAGLTESNQLLSEAMSTAGATAGSFAEFLGLTSQQYTDLYNSQDGATKVFEMFIDALGEANKEGRALQPILEDLGLSDARLVQAVLSLAVANTDAVESTSDLSNALKIARDAAVEAKGAMSNAMDREVINRLDTISGQWAILVENLKSMSLIFTDKGVGGVKDFLKSVNIWLLDTNKALREMPKEKVEMIVNALIALVALGPGLTIVGKMFSGLADILSFIASGGIAAAFAKLASFTGAISTGLIAMGDGILTTFGIMTGSTVVAAGTALAAIAAIIGVIVAGFMAFKWATSEVSFEVDVFGNKVSALTKEKIEPFRQSMLDLETTLDGLALSEKIITNDDVEYVKTQAARVVEAILNELSSDKNEALQKLEPLKKFMTPEQYDKLIRDNQTYYDTLTTQVKSNYDRINEIVNQAYIEQRDLTTNDMIEINSLVSQLQDEGYKAMTESEKEYLVAMTALKDSATQIDKQKGQEMISNAILAKNETIKIATETYEGAVAELAKMLDNGDITQEGFAIYHDALVKQRDEAIQTATDQADGVYEALVSRLPELRFAVDTETGEMASNWDNFIKSLGYNQSKNFENIKTNWANWWSGLTTDSKAYGDNLNNEMKNGFGANFLINWGEVWESVKTGSSNMWNSVWTAIKEEGERSATAWSDFGTRLSTGAIELTGGIAKTWEDWGIALDKATKIGFDLVSGGIGNAFDWIEKKAGGIINWLSTGWNLMWSDMSKGAKLSLEQVKKNFDTFNNSLKNFFNTNIIDPINGLIRSANNLMGKIDKNVARFFGFPNGIQIGLIPRLARGGMVEPGQIFEAGENGKSELMGSYKGKTTVMPLENTSFIDAMRAAVQRGVASAMTNISFTPANLYSSDGSNGDNSSFVESLVTAMKLAGIGEINMDGDKLTDKLSERMVMNQRRGR